jgi:hypothetical protein
VVFGPIYKEIDHGTGIFFCNSSFFLVVCNRIAIRHYVVTEFGCNWYLHDINIFLVSKKSL